ncbi:hypothetical protein FB446DRAFT_783022 [Lentinula raphanica]|nr:hypothetical protein FB446DRAFT_783022 [Lentinula raphanica]
MAERKQSDQTKSSRMVASTSKPKLRQKSILDLFSRKAKSDTTILVDPKDSVEESTDSVQGHPCPEHSTSNNGDPKITDKAADIPLLSEQTTTSSEQMASAPLLQASASNSNRFLTPEIQIVEHATGLREDDPIVVDNSPVKSYTRPTRTPPKALYSIFAPRARREPSLVSRDSSKNPVSHRGAPFPDFSSQHVRGPQTTYNEPPISFPLRRHATTNTSTHGPLSHVIGNLPKETSGDNANELRFHASPTHIVRAAHLTTIPTQHLQSHPVIAHLVETASSEADPFSGHSHRLWSDKWHPSRADHVLGNEEQAIFLRQWLCALEVHFINASAPPDVNIPSQTSVRTGRGKTKYNGVDKRGTKRRMVVQTVDKRKRRRIDSDDDDDSWIVYSDTMSDDESPPIDDFLEETKGSTDDAPPRIPLPNNCHSTIPLTPEHNFSFQDHLTNTILLSGPSSSGKTATVYACAQELGWEVFEVYPGVGKRSGVNLDNLIGEVGKNHLVRKTRLRVGHDSGTINTADESLISAFARGAERNSSKVGISNDHRKRSTSVTEFEFVEEHNSKSPKEHEATTQQSLILIEEVDVLFKEDVNFWGSLISLIRDCKRPVILTCNDISLVPLSDLPLQVVLNLQPCSTSVATSFLQALCCAEGYLLHRDLLSRFYERPGLHELDPPRLDLRRAIHNLQLWCPCPENIICSETIECDQEFEDMLYWDWPDDRPLANESSDASSYQVRQTYSIGDSEANHAELVSFADCYLFRKVADMPKEMSLHESADDGADEVLGYRTVQTNDSGSGGFSHFGYHDLDELIMSTIIELSRGAQACPRSADSSALTSSTRARTARVRYDETVQEIRHNVVAGQSQILRRPAFDLEYLPWIRQMVAAEDKQRDALLRNDAVGVGRRTRNSQKYSRMIELSENARKGLDATGFDWS